MTITLGLKLDFSPEEVEGKVPLIVLGAVGIKARMVELASRQKSHVLNELVELRYHKQRLEKDGVGDPEVAASVHHLIEGAEVAFRDICEIEAFLEALTEYPALETWRNRNARN
ncbi:hypothetical protein [Roseovarius mucosus]|uniref:hypothetical protein n=1 Tax=Roseovarius mucosus TaxID=215743 RepID=UPI003F71E3C4